MFCFFNKAKKKRLYPSILLAQLNFQEDIEKNYYRKRMETMTKT